MMVFVILSKSTHHADIDINSEVIIVIIYG